MQSGYVMLMLCLKARVLRDRRMEASNFANTPSLTALLNELHQSLRLLVKCLNNCAIAFEALSGMRGTPILRLALISLAELTNPPSNRPNSSSDGERISEVASSFGLLFTLFTVAH
jgi:hypothetical protein